MMNKTQPAKPAVVKNSTKPAAQKKTVVKTPVV